MVNTQAVNPRKHVCRAWFRIYILTTSLPTTSRRPRSNGLLANFRDRNRLQHIHRARLQITARIHPPEQHFSNPDGSLVGLTLDNEEKANNHRDVRNDKDSNHEGLGRVMETLNVDHLTNIETLPREL